MNRRVPELFSTTGYCPGTSIRRTLNPNPEHAPLYIKKLACIRRRLVPDPSEIMVVAARSNLSLRDLHYP